MNTKGYVKGLRLIWTVILVKNADAIYVALFMITYHLTLSGE